MNSTKSKLMASLLVLVLCVTAFFGSTYAWFTDEVVSSNNKIEAGTLDIDLEVLGTDNTTWTSIKDSHDPIFSYDKWEPGYTQAKILRVVNKGTLALQWKAMLQSSEQLTKLAEVIDVYVEPGITSYAGVDRNLTGWDKVGTLKQFILGIESTTTGTLNAKEPNATEYPYATLGIAFKMQESAGNEYQGLSLGGNFDIKILATQLSAEDDSFGKDYDYDSTYTDGISLKQTAPVTVDANSLTTEPVTISLEGNANSEVTAAVVTVPAGVKMAADVTKTTVSVEKGDKTVINSEGEAELPLEIKVEGLDANNTVPVKVEMQLEAGLRNVSVYHKGTLMAAVASDNTSAEGYYYNSANGKLTVWSKSFSPFTVKFDAEGYISTAEDLKKLLENGEDVTLACDITLEETITVKKAATLDLNGKTITYTVKYNGNNKAFHVQNAGKLTVKDSAGTGKVTNVAGADTLFWVNGNLIIESGAVEHVSNYGHAIEVREPGSIEIKGGEIINTAGGSKAAIEGYAKAESIIISGGRIESAGIGITSLIPVTITGGTIETTAALDQFKQNGIALLTRYAVIDPAEGKTVEINASNAIFRTYDAGTSYTNNSIFGGTFNAPVIAKPNTGDVTNLEIYGGTFGADPSAFVASGYEFVKNADGTYTVAVKKVTTADELKAALAEDSLVTLGADITLSESLTVASDKAVTLNLNGHDIKADFSALTSTHSAIFNVKKGASLTIKGNGDVHVIAAPTLSYVSAVIINDAGNVVIDGGNYSMTYGSYGDGYLIPTIVDTNSNVGKATTTINGGTFTHTRNMFRNFAQAKRGENNATLIINDGTFNGSADDEAAIWNQKTSANGVEGDGIVTINGGTFNYVYVDNEFETGVTVANGINIEIK